MVRKWKPNTESFGVFKKLRMRFEISGMIFIECKSMQFDFDIIDGNLNSQCQCKNIVKFNKIGYNGFLNYLLKHVATLYLHISLIWKLKFGAPQTGDLAYMKIELKDSACVANLAISLSPFFPLCWFELYSWLFTLSSLFCLTLIYLKDKRDTANCLLHL